MNQKFVPVWVLVLSIVLAFGPTPLWAQTRSFDELSTEQKQQLADLIDSAKRDYDVGNFERSLEGFQRAYDIYPHPDILYRMGLCYERLGEDAAAVRHYREFLEKVPDAPERPRIEKTIDIIESRISRSEIRVSTDPEGAVVYFDDSANGVAGYTPTALPVSPGNYRVIVQKEGYETVEELVTVEPGQTLQLRYQLTVKEKSTTAPTAHSDNVPKVAALAAVGAAAGIASGVFFMGYADASDELDVLDRKRAADKDSVTRAEYEEVESSKTTNLVLGATTGGIAVGAFVWAWVLWSQDGSATAMVPIIGWQDGPQAGMSWSW